MPLLDVRRLTVAYPARRGAVTAVDGISFAVEPGQVLGVVGESGCGKTTAALALMGLLPDAARVSGEVHFGGRDLLQLPAEALRQVRWKEIAMVFQGAMNALNPVYPVGDQIVEAILTHEPDLREREARARVAQLFGSVGLAADRRDQYPHQYSGGMKQRAVIAMSLACDPRLVIADEPTTALDVIVQDRILRELRRIQRARQLSMVYISHDMAVVAEIADVVAVMYAGRIVEMGPTAHLYARPVHPYTAALMASSPSLHGPKEPLASLGGAPPDLAHPPPGCRFHPRCPRADAQCAAQDPPFVLHRDGLTAACWHPLPAGDGAIDRQVTAGDAAGLAAARAPIVEVTEVRKLYPVGRQVFRRARHFVHALDGVSVSLAEGEVLGLVGESGSGKTTLGRLIVGLETPTSGTVRVRTDGSFAAIPEIERRTFRRHVQMIFQDPYESLNPRMTIGRIVAEPLDVLAIGDAAEREARVGRMLERVGLAPATYGERYPHELSGGQRQRVAIARAMVVEPRVVVADEPTSMLDVSVRAGIMELLIRFRRELGISYLYITHDLAVARFICDRIAVLYQGVIVELGATEAVLQHPLHPYTQALIAAVPVPDPAYRRPEPSVESSVPAAIDPQPTCRFLDRCPAATERCRVRPQPVLVERRPGHWVACDEVPSDTGLDLSRSP
jgi:peptide/nickel transport system ATP-binding protein